VFQLSPAGRQWTQTVLYRFAGGNDGANPVWGVILDAAGNLYGTTPFGGEATATGHGTVFELSSSGSGGWTESVLYRFTGQNGDGKEPQGGLLFDQQGNLYGTTYLGGVTQKRCCGTGTVFELSPGIGGWSETVLWTFPAGGDFPMGTLVADAAGNLYGTTQGTAYSIWGSVFELSQKAGGTWNETVLHEFPFPVVFYTDGYAPESGVILDSLGNLYGTTTGGGTHGGGIVYEITP
jgi:uncharacterized repeat protein (TIGR03803 family)